MDGCSVHNLVAPSIYLLQDKIWVGKILPIWYRNSITNKKGSPYTIYEHNKGRSKL